MEAVFERVRGVAEVVSGYSGGNEPDPTYEQVGRGGTGHAESVQVYFDSAIVSFETLLDVLFHVTDPTQANGQHPDYGSQYRTAVFYHDARQQAQVSKVIATMEASGEFKKPIVTEVSAFKFFQEAEAYHQDYYRNNPKQAYVVQWTIPKVKKFQKLYPELYVEVDGE
jgi:peptide-methionine (S)-S-oxide reductase